MDHDVDTVSSSTYGMLEVRRTGTSSSPRSKSQARAATGQSRTTTIVVIVCIAILVVLTMLGGLLNVGDHLMRVTPALGWLFYIVLALAVAVGIIWPLVAVARRPVFSLYQLRDEQGHAKHRRCRMLVDNLIANTDVSDEEVAQLEGYLAQGDEADDLLIEFFEKKCIPQIDASTKRAATTAFFTSAICRSPLIDTVTMLSISLDLVRSIVEVCGFRPTNAGLARLYLRVMLSALIVGGIEDSDLQDLIGTLLGGGAGARATGLLLGSATEGLVSAFLVFRVGVITKKYLCAEDGPARMAQIRRSSYREALNLMTKSGFMSEIAQTARKGAGTVASSVATTVKDAAESAGETAVHTAKDAVDAVVKTAGRIGGAAAGVVDAAAGMVEGVVDTVFHRDQGLPGK